MNLSKILRPWELPLPTSIFYWGADTTAETGDLASPWSTSVFSPNVDRAIPVPISGIIRKLTLSGMGGNFTNNITVTLLVNGTPTLLAVSLLSGSDFGQNDGKISVNRGDKLSIQYTTTAAGVANWISAIFEGSD